MLQLQRRYADTEREALAGYEIISKQSTPPPLWLNRARDALATVYESTGRPALATRYRVEMTSSK